MVTGSDLEQSVQAIELAKRFPGKCYATVGVHPCSAGGFEGGRDGEGEGGDEGGKGEGGEGGGKGDGGKKRGEELLKELEKVAREGMEGGWVVAFGEIGVDFDRLGLCKKEVQERWFERQVEVAVKVCFKPFFNFFWFGILGWRRCLKFFFFVRCGPFPVSSIPIPSPLSPPQK